MAEETGLTTMFRANAPAMHTAAPIPINVQKRFAGSALADVRMPVAKTTETPAVPPARQDIRPRDAQFRETRTLVQAHAAFGAQ